MKSNENQQSYIEAGYVHSPQGVRGEVFVVLFEHDDSWLDQWSSLHLSKKGEGRVSVELAIVKKRPHHKQGKEGWALRLKGVDTRNDSEELKGKTVWVPDTFVTSVEGEAPFLREVIGYQVVDQALGPVGEVIDVMSSSFQEIITVKSESGKIFDLPFVEDFIESFDRSNKTVHMDLPEGLVEE